MKKEFIYRIFTDIPQLKTERLLLRRLCVDDADDMYEYAKIADVTKFVTWYPHKSKEYTLEYLQYLQCRYRSGDFYDWAVVESHTGKMVGTCGFTRFYFPHNCAEVGYVINPSYQNKGIATEALSAVIKFGFENLKLERIESKFIVENEASKKVMEKNGMTFEGIRRNGMLVKDKYRNIGICSILKEEFYKNQNKNICFD